MNASELMMGNWVRHRGTNGKVQATYFEGVELSDRYGLNEWNPVMAEVEPIPLTEEVLLRCGFSKLWHLSQWEYAMWVDDGLKLNAKFVEDRSGKRFLLEVIFTNENADENIDLSEFSASRQYEIYGTHQLQNLYHALTGQELKIEL